MLHIMSLSMGLEMWIVDRAKSYISFCSRRCLNRWRVGEAEIEVTPQVLKIKYQKKAWE
jgi:endogenous inhibitor of DNA gyrase (YacG/DUF329 family)